jgi:putative transposase
MKFNMDNEKFQNRYRIASARAQWHAYDGGAYFVTINTYNHIHYFGEIANGEMQMSAIGRFTWNSLQQASIHYPYANIPIFTIMPDHLHAIVFIDENKIPDNKRRDAARHVSTDIHGTTGNAGKNAKMQNIANQSGWLSVCIGGIKSAITKYARENNINFAWQTRFYDRIIRDTDEMDRIILYINDNIANWKP